MYAYDPFDRRLSKTVYRKSFFGSWTPQIEENYLYDEKQEIGAIDTEGKCAQLRILGRAAHGETGSAVAFELEGLIYVPIHDLFGNVAILFTHSVSL